MKLARTFSISVLLCVVGVLVAMPAEAQRRGRKPAPKVDVAAARADLVGEDAAKAAAAARRLGEASQPAALDALLNALAMGLSPDVAAPALAAVGSYKSKDSLDVLLAYSRHRDAGVRAAALLALGELDGPRATRAWRDGFSDGSKEVRAAAAAVAMARKDKASAEPMMALLKKGDEAMSEPLAAVAGPEIVRDVAELMGQVPDGLLATTLGKMLLRKDLGKEQIYVELVRAIGKIPGDEAIVVLTEYLGAVPENPPRQSRREAQAIYEQRLGGE